MTQKVTTRLLLLIFLFGVVPPVSIAQTGKDSRDSTIISQAIISHKKQDRKVVFDMPIPKAIKLIEERHGIVFIYDSYLLNDKTVKYKKALPDDALKAAKDVLTGYNFRVVSLNDHSFAILPIVVTQSPAKKISDVNKWNVTGTVIDSGTKEPLPGVDIVVKGTTVGTATDQSGHYSLSVPARDDTLLFTYIGYEKMVVPINGRSTIDVKMSIHNVSGQQLVVIGYGTQKKIDLTSSIASISGSKIQNVTVPNALSALQGRLSGVQITNNGTPGSQPSIRIRGTGSIYNSNPLYVVDGMIVDNIDYLSPDDIQSVSVLKDASASAIYGVRAANGVILITTKKGTRNGKMRVTVNAYDGYQTPSHLLKMVNSPQYITLYNERLNYTGMSNQDLNPANFTTNTDWFNQVLTGSFTNNEDISIEGGTQKSSFNIGVNHLLSNGLIKNNNYEKLGLRVNYDFDISQHVKAGMNLVAALSKSNPAPNNLLLYSYRAIPFLSPKNPDGTFSDPSSINGFTPPDGTSKNPDAMLYYNHQWNNKLEGMANFYVEINFLKNFDLKSTLGLNPTFAKSINFTPQYTVSANQENSLNTLSKGTSDNLNTSWDNILTYTNSINNKHNFTVMAGYTYRVQTTDYLSGSARGLVDLPVINQSYLFLTLGKTPDYSVDASDGGSKKVQIGFMGRVNYNYMHRYLLNVTMRADGSSNFPKNNRWGYFPSVGVGWVISDENFMQNIPLISLLKIRAGWGSLGNDNIPPNLYQLTTSNANPVIFGPDQNTGNGPVSPAVTITKSFNPNLKWEVVNETNIGLDFGFFSNRLTGSLDWYHKMTNDAIFATTALGSSGLNTSGVWGNYANILNQGVEATIGWKNVVGNLQYNVSVNGTFNSNKVTKINSAGASYYDQGDGNDNITPLTRTKVGSPVGEFFGYKAIGVFQNQQQIDNTPHLQNTVPGDLIFADVNGDGKIDASDRTAIGNPNPPFIYGFNLGFSYKAIDFNVLCQGVYGNKIVNENRILMFTTRNYDENFYKNRWHGQGTSNTYPSVLITAGDPRTPNSFYVEDGSYFRIKSIQLGYTVPQRIVSKLNLGRLRFYANAENPLTSFKYNGFSPEVASNNPLMSGINKGVYPLSSIYSLGINVTF
ncbi:MAG TPA: TonB-dependent receptor [Balneolales bacterium]|nr:TonB-dependent receptor [Balneolales bacterium]